MLGAGEDGRSGGGKVTDNSAENRYTAPPEALAAAVTQLQEWLLRVGGDTHSSGQLAFNDVPRRLEDILHLLRQWSGPPAEAITFAAELTELYAEFTDPVHWASFQHSEDRERYLAVYRQACRQRLPAGFNPQRLPPETDRTPEQHIAVHLWRTAVDTRAFHQLSRPEQTAVVLATDAYVIGRTERVPAWQRVYKLTDELKAYLDGLRRQRQGETD